MSAEPASNRRRWILGSVAAVAAAAGVGGVGIPMVVGLAFTMHMRVPGVGGMVMGAGVAIMSVMIVPLGMRGCVRAGRWALVIVRVGTGGGGHRRTFPLQSGLFDWKP